MAPERADGPAEGQHDTTQKKKPEAAARRPSVPPTRTRPKKGRHGKDPAKVERARLALELSAGNVQQASKASGVAETTIRRWIADGDFDQDKWDAIRDERKRSAIELAYDGLSAQLDELRQPHHKIVTRPDGTKIDEGPTLSPQAVRAQVEVIRVLGGGPAKAGEEEGTGQPTRIEIVWPDYTPDGKVVPFRRAAS